MKAISDEILVCIIAHEYVHSILDHILQHRLTIDKRRKRNKALSAVAVGITAASHAIVKYNEGMYGIEVDDKPFEVLYNELPAEANKDLMKFYYSYSREQEYEADLVAYRFLEWIGYGGDYYIEMLKMLEANTPLDALRIEEVSNDDHPTFRDRMNFLKFVKDNPQIANTANRKIRDKKRMTRVYDDIYYEE